MDIPSKYKLSIKDEDHFSFLYFKKNLDHDDQYLIRSPKLHNITQWPYK
jgi:hypothetical protein